MSRPYMGLGLPICFIDTETTELDVLIGEVIEVAMIRVEPDGTETTYYTRIKPERIEDAHPKALEVNGYSANSELWDDAPLMSEVGGDILAFMGGAVICGHNVSFDENMLNINLKKAGVPGKVPYHKIDTVTLAYEHLLPLGLPRVSMDPIRDFLGISQEGAHTATKDAQDVKRVFERTFRRG